MSAHVRCCGCEVELLTVVEVDVHQPAQPEGRHLWRVKRQAEGLCHGGWHGGGGGVGGGKGARHDDDDGFSCAAVSIFAANGRSIGGERSEVEG